MQYKTMEWCSSQPGWWVFSSQPALQDPLETQAEANLTYPETHLDHPSLARSEAFLPSGDFRACRVDGFI